MRKLTLMIVFCIVLNGCTKSADSTEGKGDRPAAAQRTGKPPPPKSVYIRGTVFSPNGKLLLTWEHDGHA